MIVADKDDKDRPLLGFDDLHRLLGERGFCRGLLLNLLLLLVLVFILFTFVAHFNSSSPLCIRLALCQRRIHGPIYNLASIMLLAQPSATLLSGRSSPGSVAQPCSSTYFCPSRASLALISLSF